MSGPAGAASYRHLTDEDTQKEPPPPYSPQASGQQNGSSQGNLVPNQGEQEVPMALVPIQEQQEVPMNLVPNQREEEVPMNLVRCQQKGEGVVSSQENLVPNQGEQEVPMDLVPSQKNGEGGVSSQENLVPNQGEQEVPINLVRCQLIGDQVSFCQEEKEVTVPMCQPVLTCQPMPKCQPDVLTCQQQHVNVVTSAGREKTLLTYRSVRLRCPTCSQVMHTTVERVSSSQTHNVAIRLLMQRAWLFPCAFLPYCCNSCKDTHHYCSKCGDFLGVHKF